MQCESNVKKERVSQMLDSDDSDHCQRYTTLVTRELAKLNISITPFSELCNADHRSPTEKGVAYTLFESGRGKDNQQLSEIGFKAKNCIACRLCRKPFSYLDCIMSLQLPIQDKKFTTIIRLYTPTVQANLEKMRPSTIIYKTFYDKQIPRINFSY